MKTHFEYNRKELIGAILVIILSMISNAGGVGAGLIIVPVYILFYGFVSSDAIPLSRVTIFSGSLTNYVLNFNQRDPHNQNQLLINYSLCAVMMPLLLAGTQIGVICSRFFPAAVIMLVLAFYLVTSAKKIFKRAKNDSEIERIQFLNEKMKENYERIPSSGLENKNNNAKKKSKLPEKPIYDSTGGNSPVSGLQKQIETSELVKEDADFGELGDEEENNLMGNESTPELPSQSVQTVKTLKESSLGDAKDDGGMVEVELQNERVYPLWRLLIRQLLNGLLILFGLMFLALSALARGAEAKKSIFGLESCGKASWAVLLSTQVLAIGMAFAVYNHNKPEFELEDRAVKNLDERQKRMEVRKKLIWASYLTGVVAGSLGVGGGMIIGNYMLEIGMDAHLTTALSTFLVLLSSTATTFQFMLAGAIHMRHAPFFMLLSLIGSLIGNFLLKALVKKYRRPSIIVWTLFGVMCVAGIVLPFEMVLNIMGKSSSAIAFGKLC